VDPRAVIERVWPGREVVVEPLGGGITNHNFKVAVDGSSYVLRVGGKDTELLGIDRLVEEAAARMAAGIGVGPEVVDVLRPEGYLVTRFIDGEPIPVETMRTPAMIERLALALRAIHDGPSIPGRFDSHRVVETYREAAEEHGVRVPDAYAWAHGVSSRIERARGPQPLVPCHNDYLNANFIRPLRLDDGGRDIRIVDWEYAGMGDRFFDLGNVSVNHEFELDHDEALLAAYAGTAAAAPGDVASLRLMRFMSDFREAMWGVVQQGISQLDFDFVNYADEHFERLRQTAADPRFETWLAAVER
jgi:thiamine kinase-like enzyme